LEGTHLAYLRADPEEDPRMRSERAARRRPLPDSRRHLALWHDDVPLLRTAAADVTADAAAEIGVPVFRLVRGLWLVVGALFVLGAATVAARLYFGHGQLLGLVPLFRLDREANLPTWWSSTMLLFAAVVLAALGHADRRRTARWHGHWTALAVIFLAMAIDETAQMHEIVGRVVRKLGNTTGVFYMAWTLPALAFVVAVGVSYLRFLLALPRATAIGFVVAGALYVGGALGFELIGSPIDQLHQERHPLLAYLTLFEETLEMAGVVLFVACLLRFAAHELGAVRIRLDDAGDLAEASARRASREASAAARAAAIGS
jgi:hypothetical protein